MPSDKEPWDIAPNSFVATASVVWNGTIEQQETIKRMRENGTHVTVWGAPDWYVIGMVQGDDDNAA